MKINLLKLVPHIKIKYGYHDEPVYDVALQTYIPEELFVKGEVTVRDKSMLDHFYPKFTEHHCGRWR